MKIAILGNMNNNGFSIMRYFRDLDLDAHLLQFSNDGEGAFSHFRVDDDTWCIDKWKPFIHRTKIGIGYHSIIGFPKSFQPPVSTKYIEKILEEYDYIIGSGMAPMILSKTNRNLDIFFPYSIGLDYVGTIPVKNRLKKGILPVKLLVKYAQRKQIEGIKKSRYCLNAEMSLTKDTFDELNIKFLPLAVPMLYNGEKVDMQNISKSLNSILTDMKQFDFIVLSHARQFWVKTNTFSMQEWKCYTKNSDWLLKGFAKIVKENRDRKPLLILLEYGQDVEPSKQLCKDLKIEQNVLWLPTMSRKEIMILLSACDVGVGEFLNIEKMLWGGTGWEILASGKPLLQSFRFQSDEYKAMFNHIPPPLLNVLSKEDIYNHLQDMINNPQKCSDIGKKSEDWFNTYNGIGLAREWANLLMDSNKK